MLYIKKIFKNKLIYILASILIIIVGIVKVTEIRREILLTPAEYIRKEFKDEMYSIKLTKVLKEINLDDKKTLVFYKNDNHNGGNQFGAYAIVEKGILGYKLVNSFGEFEIKDSSTDNKLKSISIIYSSYKESEEWIMFGVIYDDEIDKITLREKQFNIINIEDTEMRICYFLGSWKVTHEDSKNIKLIYKNGDKKNY